MAVMIGTSGGGVPGVLQICGIGLLALVVILQIQ